jgi:3-deoxy-D-manno-octulosonic-acid transferase
MSDGRGWKAIYNHLMLPLAYAAVRTAAPFHRKLHETVGGRKGVNDRWRSAASRMGSRPVWFHVASVGEYEQARPLVTRLKELRPDIPIAISVTSPSGYTYITRKETLDERNNIRFVDYLPFDFEDNARFCLAALDPRLLVFVKFDLWPNLVWESAERKIPVVLIDGTLSETSKRYTVLGRRFYSAVYPAIDKILAISEADARRFRECAPSHGAVTVAGDTRFDRVMERKRNRGGAKPRIDKNDRLTVVAGSTWPKDEEHLLGPLARLAKNQPGILLVIAPHEPSHERVEALLSWARSETFRAARLSERSPATTAGEAAQVVIVDSVGALAEIYEQGDLAYIGGSFSTGVHNVMEPAIMGIPVVFGPVHKNSFEALELLRAGAAIEVKNADEIWSALQGLAGDGTNRKEMGRRARSYVESHLGATDRCYEAIREYL